MRAPVGGTLSVKQRSAARVHPHVGVHLQLGACGVRCQLNTHQCLIVASGCHAGRMHAPPSTQRPRPPAGPRSRAHLQPPAAAVNLHLSHLLAPGRVGRSEKGQAGRAGGWAGAGAGAGVTGLLRGGPSGGAGGMCTPSWRTRRAQRTAPSRQAWLTETGLAGAFGVAPGRGSRQGWLGGRGRACKGKPCIRHAGCPVCTLPADSPAAALGHGDLALGDLVTCASSVRCREGGVFDRGGWARSRGRALRPVGGPTCSPVAGHPAAPLCDLSWALRWTSCNTRHSPVVAAAMTSRARTAIRATIADGMLSVAELLVH